MTIHRKIRVVATVLLALLLLVEVRKRSYEDASARFVEAVGTADAVLRSRHDLGVVEIASDLLWRDATAVSGRLTPWERRLVVPLPPLPLDDPRLGDFPELRGMSDTETMAEYHLIRRRIEGGRTVNAATERWRNPRFIG